MVIDTLQLDIIVNNKGTTARINSTTNALKNLHKVITDINGAGGVNGTINGGGGGGGSSSSRGSSARGSANLAKNLSKSLNFGSMVAKLYFVRNITKQLGQDLAKVVQYGIDYEETLNLWQVAMRGNISQARTFVSEMRNAYGIASATLMNYQATFKNMLSALDGLNEDVAYGLSEALTGMALDYASLYNTSIESAMTKFQAVLAGQVRPIRSESGYDITESTIFGIYQELGGTKSVRQLDQMEKRLLRILAVYKQMQDTATGDLAKTITSSANQLRVMKEQSQEFATWIGVAFNTMLEKSGILIEINAYLYALSALAEQFAISLGYVEKDYSIKEPIDEANTALDGANEKVDELQGKLLGFDKFQVLSTGNVDNGNVDLAAEITKAIQEYERIISDAENPAFKRSLELLQAWGLELDENGKIVGGFDKVKERAKEIVTSLGTMLVIVGLLTKPWLVLVGALELAYLTNDGFRKVVNWLVEGLLSCKEAIILVVSALIAWKAINFIEKTLIPMITKLKALVTQFNLTQVAAAGMALYGFMVASNAAKNLFTSWEDMSGFERAIEIFKILAGAALVAAAAVAVFHTSWSVGVAAGVIAAGIAVAYGAIEAVKAKQAELEYHANGGLATKGSLFYAGEAGPELVTQTSGGGSTIMNMKQLEDAVARGFIRGFASTDRGYEEDDATEVYVDGQRLFNIMRSTAKRNGYDFVRV